MKIAFVVGAFPVISETFILNQITGLIDLGEEVDIFAFNRGDNSKVHPEVIEYNLLDKTYYFDIPKGRIKRIIKAIKILLRYFLFHPIAIIKCLNFKKYGGKYYVLNNLFKIEPFLRKKYDIVHCHFGPNGNEMVFLKDIFPEIKFIVTFHGYDIRLGLEKGGKIYKKLFQKADRVISICDYNTQILKKLGCPSKKIVYHPNGIDLEKFKPNGKAKNENYFVITTVARLVEEKNILFALEVIKALKEEGRFKFKYYLIGDGYMRKEIEQKIHKLGLENAVVLHGALSHEEVIEKLKETDIFFLPSKAEAFPTVILEAQAMAIPIIATNIGSVKETFRDKISGYLLSCHSIEDAKNRIICLMEGPTFIISMGKAGRKFVEENFDIRKLNKRLVEIYKKIINAEG